MELQLVQNMKQDFETELVNYTSILPMDSITDLRFQLNNIKFTFKLSLNKMEIWQV